MISDQKIQASLAARGYDETRRWLIESHNPRDQTLDMKLMRLEDAVKGLLG